MTKKRIYLVLDSTYYAGIESHVLHLSTLIKRKNAQPIVIFINDYGQHPLESKLTNKGIPYQKLDGTFLALLRLVRTLSDGDVIHTHGYKAGILCRMLCKLYTKPCISTYHAGDKGAGKLALYTWLDKITSRLSINIAVSSSIKNWLGGNATVQNNFISPLPIMLNDYTKTRNIAYVGRVSYEKGPDIFVSVAHAFKNNVQCKFAMYGSGPMFEEIRRTAPNNVNFKGFCADMERHWKNIDILIISSREEGMPMVAIEAMMQGVIVISTPCGAMPRLLENDRGMVTQIIHSEALINALKEVIQMGSSHRQKMAVNAHNYVNKHCTGESQWAFLANVYDIQ